MHDGIFDASATADEVFACLNERGYAVIHSLAPAETMDRLNADFDPYIDAVQLGRTDFAGFRTKRINNLVAKSKACQELAEHPLVMALCDRVLLPYCVRYHLHVTALIELQPGEHAQELHRDGDIYPVQSEIPMTLSAIWACNDFTAENGGTRLVPGSHRWPRDRQPREEEVVSAVMPRGSLLVYASNLIHGGGANNGQGVRRGMTLQYNLGWLRQEENQYLSLPVEVARTLPESLQRLIGYDLGGPYLGFVEEGSPLVLLHEGREHDMARATPELWEGARRVRPLVLAEVAERPQGG